MSMHSSVYQLVSMPGASFHNINRRIISTKVMPYLTKHPSVLFNVNLQNKCLLTCLVRSKISMCISAHRGRDSFVNDTCKLIFEYFGVFFVFMCELKNICAYAYVFSWTCAYVVFVSIWVLCTWSPKNPIQHNLIIYIYIYIHVNSLWIPIKTLKWVKFHISHWDWMAWNSHAEIGDVLFPTWPLIGLGAVLLPARGRGQVWYSRWPAGGLVLEFLVVQNSAMLYSTKHARYTQVWLDKTQQISQICDWSNKKDLWHVCLNLAISNQRYRVVGCALLFFSYMSLSLISSSISGMANSLSAVKNKRPHKVKFDNCCQDPIWDLWWSTFYTLEYFCQPITYSGC